MLRHRVAQKRLLHKSRAVRLSNRHGCSGMKQRGILRGVRQQHTGITYHRNLVLRGIERLLEYGLSVGAQNRRALIPS